MVSFRRWIGIAAVIVLSLCACQHDAPRPSNDAEVPSLPPPPPPANLPPATVGQRIDDALVVFRAQRATHRRSPSSSAIWSQGWLNVLPQIDEALQSPPSSGDMGAFVRARVTLEVELTEDQARQRLLPGDVEQRLRATLVAMDERVIELRAVQSPGGWTASTYGEDHELVLRAPIAPMVVSSPFGLRRDPFLATTRFHSGADFVAEEGRPVYASASGIVVYAGPQGGYGRYVVLDHGAGVRTHYAHLSKIVVSMGGFASEGDVIGYVGSTGRSTGPHLHFAVTNDAGVFLDPVALMDVPYATYATQVRARDQH
jgi:murein DD-endopeptidase MepM/ murein hydrolase activator NlpD